MMKDLKFRSKFARQIIFRVCVNVRRVRDTLREIKHGVQDDGHARDMVSQHRTHGLAAQRSACSACLNDNDE